MPPSDVIIHDDRTSIVGRFEVQDDGSSEASVVIDPEGAEVLVGGGGQDGNLTVLDSGGKERIMIGGGQTTADPNRPLAADGSIRTTATPTIRIVIDQTLAEEIGLNAGQGSGGVSVGRPIGPGGIPRPGIPRPGPIVSEAPSFELDLVEAVLQLQKEVKVLRTKLDGLTP